MKLQFLMNFFIKYSHFFLLHTKSTICSFMYIKQILYFLLHELIEHKFVFSCAGKFMYLKIKLALIVWVF